MKRYETDVRDGVLSIDGTDGWFEVGELDEICELVGGETYTIEYSDSQRTMDWLDTDADGTLTIDVRETIRGMDYNEGFVTSLEGIDDDATDAEGHPLRTAVFADRMTSIWDSKGNLENG